jgi:hypothetical protein
MAAPGFPIFDAGHHLSEIQDASTRYLSKDPAHLLRYVPVDERMEVVIPGGNLFDLVGVRGTA